METRLKMKPKRKHLGKNVAKIRLFRGMKQWTLGQELGMTQQEISDLEKEEEISDDVLEKISDVLGISVDGIKNFDEQAVIYNINHYNDIHDNTYHAGAGTQIFNEPSEKIAQLYERLLDILEIEKRKLKD